MEKKPHPALAAVRAAFPSTVPVLTGYLVLGIAYGVLMQTKGYGVPWVLLMCCLAYEESAYEYLNSIMPMVGSTVRTPDGLGTVLEVNPVSGYLRVRCGTEALTPRYYKVGVCEYISGGKRAPRRPDPDDDYSGVRNPAPVVAAADANGRTGCGNCPKKEK